MTMKSEDAKEAAEIFRGERPGYTYGRWDNPTVELFENFNCAIGWITVIQFFAAHILS